MTRRRKRPRTAQKPKGPPLEENGWPAGRWTRTGRFADAWPIGEYWPDDGSEICQYSAAGEVASFGALFRGLKRKYGRHKVLWWAIVAIAVVYLVT